MTHRVTLAISSILAVVLVVLLCIDLYTTLQVRASQKNFQATCTPTSTVVAPSGKVNTVFVCSR